MGDVITALPFRNIVEKVVITGEILKEVLEVSAAKYNPNLGHGAFMQYSGMT